MATSLVNKKAQLKKFTGKGGWTYIEIPEIKPDKTQPFGWVKVNGWIDDFELYKIKLMPMGDGSLFLPVKANIRKKIKKQAGDWVHLQLSLDETPLEIPQEIKDCFALEPSSAWARFQQLAENEQKRYLDWIYEAKTTATKAQRIAQMMDKL